jgi:hypothetical protein
VNAWSFTGMIWYGGQPYDTPSGFGAEVFSSLGHCDRRGACNGWRDVRWQGESLAVFRDRCVMRPKELSKGR